MKTLSPYLDRPHMMRYALWTRDDKTVERLLDYAPAETFDSDDLPSLLSYAITARAVRLIVAAGADLFKRSKHGKTCVAEMIDAVDYLAPSRSKSRAFAEILKIAPVLATIADSAGWTPLHSLARADKTPAETRKMASALISAGADVGARLENGVTPLHLASNVSIARALIAAGADPWSVTVDGRTTLDYAESRIEMSLAPRKARAVLAFVGKAMVKTMGSDRRLPRE